MPGTRKYPPAEPGALGLLAPQRGLTAILKTKLPYKISILLITKAFTTA
jgi:hypothetical protein